MELSMDYFDSEALTKEQEIGHLKAPPPPYFPAKIVFKWAPPEYDISLEAALCDQRML